MAELERVRDIVRRLASEGMGFMSRDKKFCWQCQEHPAGELHECPLGETCGCCGPCLAKCVAAKAVA